MSARRFRRERQRASERETRRLSTRSRAAIATASGLGATVLFAPSAQAETFTVTKLDDDGTAGTLRNEIEDANGSEGPDTIVFASGLTGTIDLSGQGSDIEIYSDGLDIQGPGADQITVDGSDDYRIFDLYNFDDPGADVTISGLTLTNGYYNGNGGAVRSSTISGYAADLTIADSVLTDNLANGNGGALYSFYGSLTIQNTHITSNESGSDGGGIGTYYAGRAGSPSTGVTISDSAFSGNTAYQDGGAAVLTSSYEDVLIENTAMSGNHAGDVGGGAELFNNEDGASATIRNSTVSDNVADNYGGGLALFGNNSPDSAQGNGPTVIENSTISGNEASYYAGGIGFYDGGDQANAIRNSTIVDNRAGTGPGAMDQNPGGGIYRYAKDNIGLGAAEDNLELSSTIVANNSPTDLDDNADGSFITGFSLIEDTGNATIDETPAGSNLLGVEPELGPLANNGGPTQTLLPSLSSPALDAGIANGLTEDQRGQPRTFDAVAIANHDGSDGTDIGATELQPGENGLPGNGDCFGAVVPSKTGTDAPDTLTGTEGPDALFGAGGDDTLQGLGANDCVFGEAGNDTADGGEGDDLVDGGEGNDNLKGSGGADQLLGQTGKDRLNGGPGKDQLTGAAGKDKLKGAGGKDKLIGGAGKDKLNPGKGKDKVKGNGGKDKLNTADGKKDKVNCGGGKDKAKVDAKDKVANNCDVVKVRG